MSKKKAKVEEEKSFSNEIIDFFKDLVIIVIVVKIITLFLVSVFIINGQSMYASYYDKEFILVDRFSTLQVGEYKTQKVIRWDVVVFKPWVDKYKEFFIKRVVGLPWDSIKIEEWKVFLKQKWEAEFKELNEGYLNLENKGNTTINGDKKTNIYLVPEWKYFVMWDNRNHSSDSRTCFNYSCKATSRDNFIGKDYVIWKVLVDFGYFNFKKFSFTHPDSALRGLSTKPRWMNSPDSYSY